MVVFQAVSDMRDKSTICVEAHTALAVVQVEVAPS